MRASVHEAKANLSELLEAVARGERVVITRHGIPAAELVPATGERADRRTRREGSAPAGRVPRHDLRGGAARLGRGVTALLLDTNAFAMLLTDDPRLPGAARRSLAAADRAAISAISFHEMDRKVRLGRWPEMAPFAPGLVERARDDGLELLPLSPVAAMEASLLDWDHRDPFDRMIAVVALGEGLRLLSSDAAFDSLDWN